ncbi:MAG: hypothetical protein ACP5N7_02720 [Candidatus Pacearchaeota archaeon]
MTKRTKSVLDYALAQLRMQKTQILRTLDLVEVTIAELRQIKRKYNPDEEDQSPDIRLPLGPYRKPGDCIYAILNLNEDRSFTAKELLLHVKYLRATGVLVTNIARLEMSVSSALSCLKKSGDIMQPGPHMWQVQKIEPFYELDVSSPDTSQSTVESVLAGSLAKKNV